MTQAEKFTLLITDEHTDKLINIKPWEQCKKCKHGYLSATQFCECTIPSIFETILDIPKRYDVGFAFTTPDGYWKEMVEKVFVLLKGQDLYTKLVAFYLAKQLIKERKVVVYTCSKTTMTPYDHSAITQADVVIFNDSAGSVADINYKIELDKRIDNNKSIIFLNIPLATSIFDSNTGKLSTDVFEYDVDSINIKVGGK